MHRYMKEQTQREGRAELTVLHHQIAQNNKCVWLSAGPAALSLSFPY